MSTEPDLPREAQQGAIFHPDWGTHAYVAYDQSVTELDALLAMVFTMSSDTERSARYLEARRLQIENDFSGPWLVDVRKSMLTWQVAMRVAAVEVYLQDALTFLAVYDPEFMRTRKSIQPVDYGTVCAASDSDESLWSYCNRWARGFVADGGPGKWAVALTRSGLGKFDSVDLSLIEGVWGFRHLRVHQAGRLSRDFVSRHEALAGQIHQHGVRVSDLRQWSDAATQFVQAAEAGISGRLRGVLGERLIADREEAELERQLGVMSQTTARAAATTSPEEVNARIEGHVAEAEKKFALMAELFSGVPIADADLDHGVGNC